MQKKIPFFVCFCANVLLAQSVPVFDSLQLMYADTLYFESGKWDLDTFALAAINQFPESNSPKDRIYLTGHTDAIGSLEFNEELAKKRAQIAKDRLLEKNWTEEMMVIQTFGERSPMASNLTDDDRKLNRRVRIDLFRAIPYITLNGKITDPETGEGIPNTQLRIHSRFISDSLKLNEMGDFQLKLPLDSVIGLDIFAQGYFFKTHMMKVKVGMKPTLNISLQKAEIGAAADLSKLYFVGNKAVLLEHSKSELTKIKYFLLINNHLRVEIAGHVNYPNRPPVAEDTFEWDLSVRRAQFLYDWLLGQGISKEQISYKGYGNHEMRYPRATSSKEQELNRRVEIRILGKM